MRTNSFEEINSWWDSYNSQTDFADRWLDRGSNWSSFLNVVGLFQFDFLLRYFNVKQVSLVVTPGYLPVRIDEHMSIVHFINWTALCKGINSSRCSINKQDFGSLLCYGIHQLKSIYDFALRVLNSFWSPPTRRLPITHLCVSSFTAAARRSHVQFRSGDY